MADEITSIKDSQWIRYRSKFGDICIFRSNPEMVCLIPAHMPSISLSVARKNAAIGLREWRRKLRSEQNSEGISPVRVQLSRKRGWKMPSNTVSVARPGRWGNPFRIGGWFMVGDPDPKARMRMSWCQAANAEIAARTPGKFTLIETQAQAVEFFERLAATGYFRETALAALRGKNLACWCKLGTPCHADILLKLANSVR